MASAVSRQIIGGGGGGAPINKSQRRQRPHIVGGGARLYSERVCPEVLPTRVLPKRTVLSNHAMSPSESVLERLFHTAARTNH